LSFSLCLLVLNMSLALLAEKSFSVLDFVLFGIFLLALGSVYVSENEVQNENRPSAPKKGPYRRSSRQ
jgi:hypothetical protein